MGTFQVQGKSEDTSPSLDDVLLKQVNEADGATNKVKISTFKDIIRAALAKYNSGYTYAQGDITTKDGRTYKSVVDDNLGNDPATDSGANWVLQPEVVTGDYLHARKTSDQGSVNAAGTVISWDDSIGSLPISSNKITLRANKTYILRADLRVLFTTPVSGVISYNFYDTTNSVDLDGSGSGWLGEKGFSEAAERTGAGKGGGNLAVLTITPSTDIEVELRVTGIAGSPCTIESDASNLWVEQIGVGAYVPLAAPVFYETDAGQSIGDASFDIVDFEDIVRDNDSLVTTGAAWKYTAAHACEVDLKACVTFASTAWAAGDKAILMVYKNGTALVEVDRWECQANDTRVQQLSGTTSVTLAAGDYVDVRLYQDTGGAISLTSLLNPEQQNWVSITEIPTSTSIPKTEWKSYTPTITWVGGVGTVLGRYKDLGNELDIEVYIPVTGAVTAASLTATLPSGYTLDLLAAQSGGMQFYFGRGTSRDTGIAAYTLAVGNDGSNADRVAVFYETGDPNKVGSVTNTAPHTYANTDSLNLRFKVPVTRT